MDRYRAAAAAYFLITPALAAAKALGFVSWAWWIVLAPWWMPAMLCVIVAFVSIALFANASRDGRNPFQ